MSKKPNPRAASAAMRATVAQRQNQRQSQLRAVDWSNKNPGKAAYLDVSNLTKADVKSKSTLAKQASNATKRAAANKKAATANKINRRTNTGR